MESPIAIITLGVVFQAIKPVWTTKTLPLGFLLIHCGHFRTTVSKARKFIGQKYHDEGLGPDPLNQHRGYSPDEFQTMAEVKRM